jgi:hypothetical protein
MIPTLVTRCALGAALLLTGSSSAWSARVLHGPAGGAVRALVMGVDKYPNLDPASELHGAVADAADLAGALETGGVKVQRLTDRDVTRQRVIAEMDRLVSESKSGDLAIIAYSGHGMRVRGYKRWDGKNRNAYHSQMALSNFSPTEKNGHEVIVDAEMRAWYARLDAKGVDVLVVMDTCYGGHMRDVVPFAGGMRTRALNSNVDDKVHDSFVPIQMNEKEAGADTSDMKHVTFFAGATEESTVPEMSGVDPNNRTAVRGALSYFVARAVGGGASQDRKVTRGQLFKFVAPNVREATEGRQFIDFGPRTDSDDALQQVVFRVDDDTASGGTQNESKEQDVLPPPPPPPPPVTSQVNAVRIAIINGAKGLFSTIEKGKAPFIQSEQPEADVVWDVQHGAALSRGDLIMNQVDASVLGAVIDRTWAVREIQKLATQRILDVTMGENGQAYSLGDQPKLVAGGVRNSYLTVVNVAADGTLQLLFPVYASHDPHMTADRWTYSPRVDLPLGTDYTVVIATSGPAKDLVGWLRAHNGKHDAFGLPEVLAQAIKADGAARIGTAGLFTH